MSILARDVILKEVEGGRIGIDPFDPERVGPASIDLTVASGFRAHRNLRQVIEVTEKADHLDVTEPVEVPEGESLLILPGESIFASTVESIELPEDVCGWLEGRSRFARMGLMVHVCSSFIHPGSRGRQAFDLINFGPMALSIRPGTALCQLILERSEGGARYDGTFAGQER